MEEGKENMLNYYTQTGRQSVGLLKDRRGREVGSPVVL